jgi:hypothetical protein
MARRHRSGDQHADWALIALPVVLPIAGCAVVLASGKSHEPERKRSDHDRPHGGAAERQDQIG